MLCFALLCFDSNSTFYLLSSSMQACQLSILSCLVVSIKVQLRLLFRIFLYKATLDNSGRDSDDNIVVVDVVVVVVVVDQDGGNDNDNDTSQWYYPSGGVTTGVAATLPCTSVDIHYIHSFLLTLAITVSVYCFGSFSW